MITLTAKIDLLSGNNKALSLMNDNLYMNNISSDLESVIGFKKNSKNPFIIGASKLGGGATFSENVNYVIGSQLSDKNGYFEEEHRIDIKSTNPLNTITIAFDTINNRHPKKIKMGFAANIATDDGQLGHYGELEYPIKTYLDLPENAYNVNIIRVALRGVTGGYSIVDFSFFNNVLQAKIIVYVQEGDEEQYLYENPYLTFTLGYNVPYEDNDAIFTIINLPNVTDFSIIIDNWNTPNYPLVITGIYTIIDINIDYRNLINISRSIFDRSDLKLPSFGIISNTGNIEFNDTDGEILDYAEQLLLEKGLKCEIKLNNTLVEGASQTIGLFETDQWNYDNDSRVVSVSLKDDLQEWQDIDVKGIDYDPRKAESKPFSGLYAYLWELTSNRYYATRGIKGKGNYNMLAPDELDIDTQKVLENTYIEYPFLENGTMWQQWTKLCQACQLHIYKNNEGVIVCRYNGGN